MPIALLLLALSPAPTLAARSNFEEMIAAAALHDPSLSHLSVPDAELPDLGEDFSSVLEEGSGASQNRSKEQWGEDVECFCIDYYEFVDWDDYSHYSNPEDCMQGGDRCNEKCERDPKHIITFEGKRQTLSFCGTDEGYPSREPECQCLDGTETFKHSNTKKALKKYGNPNLLTQFAHGAEHAFDGYGSSAANLRACYMECPSLCESKQKLTGGCAMPTSA
ncbi:unnamed protein product [Prorocentrum cordatum]|uniref:Uncharacterized protein n=1 Tax=Prorocentrum cordatum TaxID=2364126 RepID=A0ABN9V3Y6_9DINO|nr:unnamed protein product [Polarella glacialis]|mmetsp:Transcript_101884/g.274074  ORF Transcript_101884/g.274074 Transcript_101884/m.274074 type:complete len:221 (-) Transcript_101884:2-664(-)